MPGITQEVRENLKKKHGITDDELTEYEEAFNIFDKDGNGFIDCKEMTDVLRAFGIDPTQKQLEKLISELDTIKKDNKIEFGEFVVVIKDKKKDKKAQEEELRAAFRTFDADKSGKIDQMELKRVLTTMGEKLTDADVAEMIKDADMDGDGKISYEEFISLFTKSMKDMKK